MNGQDVWLHPNAGQWDDKVHYKVEVAMGEMLIEADGFTYYLNDARQRMGHHDTDHAHENETSFNAHVIKSKFLGSSWENNVIQKHPSSFYRNYFLGSDKDKWKSKIHSYNYIELTDYYDGIDLILDAENDILKYSFRVSPLTDPNQIVIEYSGQDKLYIDREGNLHVTNRFGEIIEKKPLAWNLDEHGNKTQAVPIEFDIYGKNNVRFVYPNDYDASQVLIIDPSLTFSTFTGSTADNWGMSATPDASGNIFGGGVAFGQGYPTTVGAYDVTWAGAVDVAITKFNSDGTALLYSTYIGGAGSETPNSMICAPNGELFIFGLTSSSSFPMAGSPFDPTFDGGPNVSASSNGLGFTAGADMFIARLSANGANLLASTYVGGTGTDGLNVTNLNYNYGDQFRGEIILDDLGNVYVASTTQSADFPTLLGPQNFLNGSQDAVIFKMPPTLDALIWSGYFGGSGDETGNSVQVSSTGDIYFVGGTTSGSLPFNSGYDQSFDGGIADGYITKLNGANGSIISGSYMGLNEYDQAYCVQLDLNDDVYVLGQTESNWAITPGCYGNPNSGQFIRKFNNGLTNIFWSTMIGAGSGHVEISPTAFLVSDCYDIYLSGWGGQINSASSQAVFSSSNGFPVTNGPNNTAYQLTTNGSNFYIAVLDQDASALKYGTYMGGTTSSANHVDGGTSRFDKQGRIYHAVCAACGGNSTGFTATPGVWSTTNQSLNCNMACFKFELSTIDAIIGNVTPVVCIPDSVHFINSSANGNNFLWDFGDNTSSTEVNPSHLYATSGSYTVSLVVSDTNGCYSPDSVEFVIHIGDVQFNAVQPDTICAGTPTQLEASGGLTYQWSPGQFLNDSTVAMPVATVDQTTVFTVIISDTCGTDTISVTLPVFDEPYSVIEDTSVCIGSSVDLFATGGVSYQWTPAIYLNNPLSATPICTPAAATMYDVEITTANNCIINDSVFVDVYFTPPVPVIPDTVFVCIGLSAGITVSGAANYSWSPNSFINQTTGPSVIVNPPFDMYYYCNFTNACGTLPDSVFVDVLQANVTAETDTTICPGDTANLTAFGGVSYTWYPFNGLNTASGPVVFASPETTTLYYVIGVDANGCIDQDSVLVSLYPEPHIEIIPGIVFADYGDIIQLTAISSTTGPYTWSPSDFLSCVNCAITIANPEENFTYTVSYIDENDCSASDVVNIYYNPILYVPNTFTPGGDEFNQMFLAIISEEKNVLEFHMEIYNRWGELIFESYDFKQGWDGKYGGYDCQDGTYVWKIRLREISNETTVHTGHINLLR